MIDGADAEWMRRNMMEGEVNCDDEYHIVQQRRLVSRVQGLMPRQRRDGGFPVSRDWADLDCWATGCRWNQQEKCIVPSICKITADGRCKGFDPKPLPSQAEHSGD